MKVKLTLFDLLTNQNFISLGFCEEFISPMMI